MTELCFSLFLFKHTGIVKMSQYSYVIIIHVGNKTNNRHICIHIYKWHMSILLVSEI